MVLLHTLVFDGAFLAVHKLQFASLASVIVSLAGREHGKLVSINEVEAAVQDERRENPTLHCTSS